MQTLSRRRVLALGGMATVVGGTSSQADAAPPTPTEQANAKIATDFCAAWVARDIDLLMPYLADTVSYRITETTPAIVGRTAFHDRIDAIIKRMTSIEFKVVDTLAKGPPGSQRTARHARLAAGNAALPRRRHVLPR